MTRTSGSTREFSLVFLYGYLDRKGSETSLERQIISVVPSVLFNLFYGVCLPLENSFETTGNNEETYGNTAQDNREQEIPLSKMKVKRSFALLHLQEHHRFALHKD